MQCIEPLRVTQLLVPSNDVTYSEGSGHSNNKKNSLKIHCKIVSMVLLQEEEFKLFVLQICFDEQVR
jgi:hypothetical protein